MTKFNLPVELLYPDSCLGCYAYKQEWQRCLALRKELTYVNNVDKIVWVKPDDCPLKPVIEHKTCSNCAHKPSMHSVICGNCHSLLRNNWKAKAVEK
jgi:hypothetical protein